MVKSPHSAVTGKTIQYQSVEGSGVVFVQGNGNLKRKTTICKEQAWKNKPKNE